MATKTFRTRVLVLLAFVIAPLVLSSCNWNWPIVRWPDEQNVLQNGSFEDPNGSFKSPKGDGQMPLPPGSTTIPGWTVMGATNVEVSWMQNDNNYVRNGATDGTHFLDLSGPADVADPKGQFGFVTQTFPTVVGFNYHLRFDIGIFNPTYNAAITVFAALSGPNGENKTEMSCGLTKEQQPGPGPQWKTCETGWRATDSPYFKAVSATTTLRIYGVGTSHTTTYIGLDRVLVDCVAPLGRHSFCTSTTLGQ